MSTEPRFSNRPIKKPMTIMLICLGGIFGSIILIKIIMSYIGQQYMEEYKNPTYTVSATKVGFESWQMQLEASGTLRAINGVDVTTEIAGLVKEVYFKPGSFVKAGDLLVELNADYEIANLRALEALTVLAKITLNRDKTLLSKQAAAQSTVDADLADLDNKQAQVDAQKVTIAKKHITAPFTGRLGINLINLGQYLNPGDKIVTLQSLDPIFVDFYLPQQDFVKLSLGDNISLYTDSYPSITFVGKITTLNPKVDPTTRNIQIEATMSNPKNQLLPGMYGRVTIVVGKPKSYLTLPQTAISYNPYGDIVYVVQETQDDSGKKILTVKQTFVEVAMVRGDQAAIAKGIKEGDMIVTGGQLKIKNGSRVEINNTIVPNNNPAPKAENEL